MLNFLFLSLHFWRRIGIEKLHYTNPKGTVRSSKLHGILPAGVLFSHILKVDFITIIIPFAFFLFGFLFDKIYISVNNHTSSNQYSPFTFIFFKYIMIS